MSTDSSANATSTQLPPPELVLFRHTMPARSKSATLPPPLGAAGLSRTGESKAAACDIASASAPAAAVTGKVARSLG